MAPRTPHDQAPTKTERLRDTLPAETLELLRQRLRYRSVTVHGMVCGRSMPFVRCRSTILGPAEVVPLADHPEVVTFAEALLRDGVVSPIDGVRYTVDDDIGFLRALVNSYWRFTRYSADWDPIEPR